MKQFFPRMAGLFCVAASVVWSQTPQPEQDFHIRTDVEIVLLDVSVRTRDGGFVGGLEQGDFRVLEDGRQQQIRFFEKEDSPVTLGLVVDTSASMRGKYGEVIAAAQAFIRASNPEDQLFVTSFNDFVWLGLPEETPFTSDPESLREALEWSRPAGRTALYDAVSVSLDHLRRGTRSRKTLVVLSDGGDNSSELNLDRLLEQIRQSPATLYTIGLYDRSDRDRNPGFLKRLAEETGGAAFLDVPAGQLASTAERIALDVRSRYTIGYTPSGTSKAGFRKIKVLATDSQGKKLEVRTRRGYLIPEETTSGASPAVGE